MKIYEKTPLMRTSRFSFIWSSGSLNDNGIKILKSIDIGYGYHNQKLYAIRNGNYYPIDYKQVHNDLFEMIIFHP